MNLSLDGRVALVVGGGRGIGRACAITLAMEGADVAVLARTQSELEATCEQIRGLGRRALALTVDATDRTAIDQALTKLRTELGPPTLLVLGAAALYTPRKLQHIEDAEADRFLAVDVGSAVSLCTRVLPDMLEARFGRIVALGSVAARTGVAGGTLYAAGKAALERLCRGIALDYSRRGINANAVAISFADTERLQGRTASDPEARARLERATATKAIPTPAEIADVVAFLCSPRAAAIT
ncbi:MAG: SDR family oxidoreductase, partial [Deltaproteobacteria bacterium]|nr:SDR family oxidoreductase [Deltaproteobacteria bacterium]